MAIVQNIREKVHLPVYDSVVVEPGKQLREVESSSTLKFFVNVQGKTKLETNLQSASLLPHYNTFEARAMRVVISDLPPKFTDEEDVDLTGEETGGAANPATHDFSVPLDRAIELLDDARNDDDGEATLEVDTEKEEEADEDTPDANRTEVSVTASDLEAAIEDCKTPPSEIQLKAVGNGGSAAPFIGNFVYNTVTSLYVGEKLMIEMPTWFFPGGAGTY